jgi:fasciclin domain-containing protein
MVLARGWESKRCGMVDHGAHRELPFTVFALISDEAFAQLPAGSVEALLAEPAQLAKVLTYHVVPGRVTASELGGLKAAATINSETLPVSVDGSLHVDRASEQHGYRGFARPDSCRRPSAAPGSHLTWQGDDRNRTGVDGFAARPDADPKLSERRERP